MSQSDKMAEMIQEQAAAMEENRVEEKHEITDGAEATEEVVEATEEVSSEVEERVFTDVEKQAIAKGWKPQDDFTGEEGKKFKTAEEYIEMGSFYDRIDSQNKTIKQLQKMVEQLGSDVVGAKETGYNQAMYDLESIKRQAVEVGDTDAYDEAHNKLEVMQAELDTIKSNKVAPEAAPVENEALQEDLAAFTDRNKEWFNQDTPENFEMASFANQVDQFLQVTQPNINPKEALFIIEKEVKQRYPDRFAGKAKPKTAPNPVMKGNKVTAAKGESLDLSDLSSTQKQLYHMAKAGKIDGMTGDEYLKALQNNYEDA